MLPEKLKLISAAHFACARDRAFVPKYRRAFGRSIELRALASEPQFKAALSIPERVHERYIYGPLQVEWALERLSPSPWAMLHVSNAFSSLIAGSWPEIFDPNALFMMAERLVEEGKQEAINALDRNEPGVSVRAQLAARRACEILGATIVPEIAVGATLPGDHLVTSFDNLVMLHPALRFSEALEGNVAYAVSKSVLSSKMSVELAEMVALLVPRALGYSLALPGMQLLGLEKLDDARSLIADVLSGDMLGLQHVFGKEGALAGFYDAEMCASTIAFTYPFVRRVDELELLARLGASRIGSRPFRCDLSSMRAGVRLLAQQGVLEQFEGTYAFPGVE